MGSSCSYSERHLDDTLFLYACASAGVRELAEFRPDGNSASPFWGSGAGDSHLWTDDQKRNYNINGVAYAQVDFPFLQGLSYRISLNARRNSAMRDVFNDPRIWVNTTILLIWTIRINLG